MTTQVQTEEVIRLRDKAPVLWAETGMGKDAECSAAQVWFEEGCWHDGTPVLDNTHYTQRPINQFQRQKLAAMFAACDWLGVAEAPDWMLKDMQEARSAG